MYELANINMTPLIFSIRYFLQVNKQEKCYRYSRTDALLYNKTQIHKQNCKNVKHYYLVTNRQDHAIITTIKSMIKA
ncbi:hypothetical protein QTP88_020186 [Uroleucon formosanum]